MADTRALGQSAFGMRPPARPSNRYPIWRYFVSVIVIGFAIVFALPNLYPPDYALQIQTDNQKNAQGERFEIGNSFLDVVTDHLNTNEIELKSAELTEDGAQLRFFDEPTRDEAKTVLEERLNPEGMDRQFVIAINLADTTPQWLKNIGGKPMTLGLDLAGGIHFVLQVDMQQAIEKQMRDEQEKIFNELRELRIRYSPTQSEIDGQTFQMTFDDVGERDLVFEELSTTYGPPHFEFNLIDEDDIPGIRLEILDARLRELEDLAIEQNLNGLRNRVNELNVSEPLVQRLGRDRIVVDLPGVQDSSEAKRILDKFATLEFRLTEKSGDHPSTLENFPYEGREVTIRKQNIITGENVIDAKPGRDPETGSPEVYITLDRPGGDALHDETKDDIGHMMAILFIEQKPVVTSEIIEGERIETTRIEEERRLISVARITAALGYQSRITGISALEARELSILLRAGALAAPMYFVEERTVGASLGAENIERGFTAVVIGFVLVLIFMLFYYKVFGFVANLALTFNLIIVVAVMSILGATLTLPGIAGIVLTVGMAVDANVLIFSRIREELKTSVPSVAIPAGYNRAFLTIFDANLTTLFVALILLTIGSGPIAGFAVTLSIGVVTSMFTAIFVSRGIVHLFYGRSKVEKVWI